MILAAHKMSKIILDVSYTFSFFALFPPYGQNYKSLFFSARQNYSPFLHKPPNQKQAQWDQVTCENKFWRQDVQNIINCPHEEFMPLSNTHPSEQVVSINLCFWHIHTHTQKKKKGLREN